MDDSKVEQGAAQRRPPNAGIGRQKGVPNKMTREVKQMILDALERAGGVAYLAEKAESHPQAFMALLGKVLPLQVQGAGENGEIVVQRIERVVVQPNDNRLVIEGVVAEVA